MASADQCISDLLVIGGGLAGERTAIEAARAGHHVVILSLVPHRRSHSGPGHTLYYAVDSVVVKLGIAVHDRMEAISLIQDGQRCFGTVARCLRTGRLITYLAKATVIATGGCGRLYNASTNAVINEGTAMGLALAGWKFAA